MCTKYIIGKSIINIKIYKDDDIIENEKSVSVRCNVNYPHIKYNFSGFGNNPNHNLHASRTQKESLIMTLNVCKELAKNNNMRSFLILGPNLEIIGIGTDW